MPSVIFTTEERFDNFLFGTDGTIPVISQAVISAGDLYISVGLNTITTVAVISAVEVLVFAPVTGTVTSVSTPFSDAGGQAIFDANLAISIAAVTATESAAYLDAASVSAIIGPSSINAFNGNDFATQRSTTVLTTVAHVDFLDTNNATASASPVSIELVTFSETDVMVATTVSLALDRVDLLDVGIIPSAAAIVSQEAFTSGTSTAYADTASCVSIGVPSGNENKILTDASTSASIAIPSTALDIHTILDSGTVATFQAITSLEALTYGSDSDTVTAVAVPMGAVTVNTTTGFVNTAEGGTNGVTVTTGNSGGASGDAFSAVAGTAVFSNAVAMHGALSYSGGNYSYTQAPVSDGYARVYGLVTSTTAVQIFGLASGVKVWDVNLSTSSGFVVRDSTSTVRASDGATAATAGRWFRMEAHFNSSNQLVASVWVTNPDSTGAADKVLTAATGTNGVVDTLKFAANVAQNSIDDINGFATSPPGPAVIPTGGTAYTDASTATADAVPTGSESTPQTDAATVTAVAASSTVETYVSGFAFFDSFIRNPVSGGWGTPSNGGNPWVVINGQVADFSTTGTTGKIVLATTSGHELAITIPTPPVGSGNSQYNIGQFTQWQWNATNTGTTPVTIGAHLYLVDEVNRYYYRVVVGQKPSGGSLQLGLDRITSSGAVSGLGGYNIITASSSLNTYYNLRTEASGLNTSSPTINARLWLASTAEPAPWGFTYTDSAGPHPPVSADCGFRANIFSGDTNNPTLKFAQYYGYYL